MKALSHGTQAALNAAKSHRDPMPVSMPAEQRMCMFAAAASAIMMTQTGVFTSVSLFALVRLLVPVLLLILVVIIISLLLIGLTGLVKLDSLVGRKSELAARSARGE